MLIGSLLLVGATSALAEVELSLEERVRRAKASEAALRSVFQTIEQLGVQVAREQAIAHKLLSDPAAHGRRNASLAQVIDDEKKRLREEVRRQLLIYVAHHPTHLDAQWVDEVMTERRKRIDRKIDEVIGSSLQERYARARAISVGQQRRQLDEEMRPTVEEIEQVVGDPEGLLRMRAQELRRIVATRGHPVVRKHVERVSADIPLFEENEDELGARMGAKLLEGAEQLQRQLRMVSGHDGGNAVEALEIGRLILGDVEKVALSGDYGVFRATRERVDERALSLERRRLNRFVDAQLDISAGCKALPAARVAAEIPDSPAQIPAKPGDHATLLIESFRVQVKEAIAVAHVNSVEQGGRQPQFLAKVRAYLEGAESAGIDQILERGIGRCIAKPLEDARRKLAEVELRAAFPEIADRAYVFDEVDLERIALGEAPATETAAQSEHLHLFEARAMFEVRWGDLVSEARSSIHVQEQIVREPALKGRYVAEITNELERTEQMRGEYEERYTSDVLRIFRERRPDLLLDPKSHKYDVVFARTREIIGEIITLEWTKERPEEPEKTPALVVVVEKPDLRAPPPPPTELRSAPSAPHESRETRTAKQSRNPKIGGRETARDAGESNGGGGLLKSFFGVPGLFGGGALFGNRDLFGSRERTGKHKHLPCEKQSGTSAACRSQFALCIESVERCASEGGACAEALSACRAARRACESGDTIRPAPAAARIEA
jgi:hypothetical protein